MSTQKITVNATTTVLVMDKKPVEVVLAPERQGTIQTVRSFAELKKMYYAGLYQRPIEHVAYEIVSEYFDEPEQYAPIVYSEVPEAFDRTIIQMWKLYLTPHLKKDLYWTVMNQKFTRIIVKEPAMDLIIKKGDIKALNGVYETFNNAMTEQANKAIIEDNLARIEALYVPEIRPLLGIKNLNSVLTPKFEQRMLDAIRKYGRDYGIEVPTRTEYNDEYHAYKKDLLNKNNAADRFQYSFTIYEDPNDQKTFIDNSQTAIVPRSKAAMLHQTEELVELHTRFVQLMYFVRTGLDILKDTQSDNFILESKLEAKRLRSEEDLMNYKYFCEVNGLEYDPDNFDSDITPEELDYIQVDTAYIR